MVDPDRRRDRRKSVPKHRGGKSTHAAAKRMDGAPTGTGERRAGDSLRRSDIGDIETDGADADTASALNPDGPRSSARPVDSSRDGDSSRGDDSSLFWLLLGGVGFLALLVRLLNVFQTAGVSTVRWPIGDAAGYLQWADQLVSDGWYGTESFYQAPLYPYFLAALKQIGWSDVQDVRLVQAVLGALAVVALGFFAAKQFSRSIGVIAAAMMAFYPPAIYYDGIIQKTGLASVLLCFWLASLAYGMQRLRETADAAADQQARPQPLRLAGYFGLGVWVLSGVLLGLLVLTRENALLWIGVTVAGMMVQGVIPPPATRSDRSQSTARARRDWWRGVRWRQSPLDWRRSVAAAAAFLCGTAIVLFPVAARNASLGGEWSPTTFQAGPNFYIGNHMGATGVYVPLIAGRGIPGKEREDAQRLAESAVGRALTAREVSRFWMDLAWQDILCRPDQWSALMFRKTLMVLNRFEVPDGESMRVYASESGILRAVGYPWWGFGMLCPLACWGIVATGRAWRRHLLHYLLLLSMIIAIVAFFVLGRYRHPLIPLLMPFAAVAVTDVFNRIRGRSTAHLLWPVVAAVGAAFICNFPVHNERLMMSGSYMNAGVAAAQANDLPAAMGYLRQSLVLNPDSAVTRFNLGRLYTLDGLDGQAIEQFAAAKRLDPTLISVDYFWALTLEKRGDLAGAKARYAAALEVDPSDRDSRVALQRLMH